MNGSDLYCMNIRGHRSVFLQFAISAGQDAEPPSNSSLLTAALVPESCTLPPQTAMVTSWVLSKRVTIPLWTTLSPIIQASDSSLKALLRDEKRHTTEPVKTSEAKMPHRARYKNSFVNFVTDPVFLRSIASLFFCHLPVLYCAHRSCAPRKINYFIIIIRLGL